MMNASKDTAKLGRLLNSDLGRRALAEVDAERGASRTAILATMRADLGELARQEAAARAEVPKLREAADAAYQAFLSAAERLAETERAASNASFAADRRRGRARHALAELGQSTIEQSRRALQFELQALRPLLGVLTHPWTPEQMKLREHERPARKTEPLRPFETARAAQVRDYLAELDALEFADTSPAEVERRCASMLDGAYRDDITPDEPRRIAGVISETGSVARRPAKV